MTPFRFTFEASRQPVTLWDRIYIAWRVFLLLTVYARQIDDALEETK